MKCATRKLRSPVKRHGGKTYLCRRFIDLFPEHHAYVEPFLGGGSVLLNKPKSPVEIASDLDAGLIRMWHAIRDRGYCVSKLFDHMPYTCKIFNRAAEMITRADEMRDVDFAAAYIVRNRMSRGGMGNDFAWSDRLRGKSRPGGAIPGDVNAWETFLADDLPAGIDRVQGVRFFCRPAIEVIQENARRGTLMYIDPPYMPETRTAKKVYEHEMGQDDHHDLVSTLKRAEERGAKVFLSGYDNPLYQEWIPRDWIIHRFEMPNHSGQGKVKQRRVECLWESQ